jgi:hypothetical protein
MHTIIELPTFSNDAKSIWDEAERGEFCAWLSNHPLEGDVIPKSGGCRKVRWSLAGTGKQGGARVIYFNRLENGVIYLMVIYTKTVRGNIPAHLLKAIKETIKHE